MPATYSSLVVGVAKRTCTPATARTGATVAGHSPLVLLVNGLSLSDSTSLAKPMARPPPELWPPPYRNRPKSKPNCRSIKRHEIQRGLRIKGRYNIGSTTLRMGTRAGAFRSFETGLSRRFGATCRVPVSAGASVGSGGVGGGYTRRWGSSMTFAFRINRGQSLQLDRSHNP